jgi:hypothetical protein
MPIPIEDQHLWWFRQLHDVLLEFADAPDNVLRRLGQVNVPEDLAGTFRESLKSIRSTYPEEVAPELLGVARAVDEVLSAKSLRGAGFEYEFWTNPAFRDHPEWSRVRNICRAFLLK